MKTSSPLFRTISSLRIFQMYPTNAVTFHHKIGLDAQKSRLHQQEAEDFKLRIGINDLYVIHGSAFIDINGNNVLIIGPNGIGKTSSLEQLKKTGQAQPLEDGTVLVGMKDNRANIITTGTIEFSMLRGKYRKRLYKLIGHLTHFAAGRKIPGRFEKDLVMLMRKTAKMLARFTPRRLPFFFGPELKKIHKVLIFNHPMFNDYGVILGATKTPERTLSVSTIKELFKNGGTVNSYKADTLIESQIIQIIRSHASPLS